MSSFLKAVAGHALVAGLAISVQSPQAATTLSDLNFSTGTVSLWGPGQSVGFRATGYAVGNSTLGVSYDVGTSSGSLSSTVRGQLAATHADQVALADSRSVTVDFDFYGAAGGGQFSTSLGAWARADGHLDVAGVTWNPNIANYGFSLATGSTFTPTLGNSWDGTGSFNPAGVRVGTPDGFPVLTAAAGVDLVVGERSTLSLGGLSGLVTARLRGTDVTRSAWLDLASSPDGMLDFDLGEAGIWDFSVTGVDLSGRFSTGFNMGIQAYIEYGIWPFAPVHLETNLPNLPLFSTPTFDLDYGVIAQANAFSITVAAPVPEPGTLPLAVAGLLGLVHLAQRRRSGSAQG